MNVRHLQADLLHAHHFDPRRVCRCRSRWRHQLLRMRSKRPCCSDAARRVMIDDHLVGTGEQRRRNFDAQYARGLRVDDKLELGGLHDGQVGGLGALEDAAGVRTPRNKDDCLAVRRPGRDAALSEAVGVKGAAESPPTNRALCAQCSPLSAFRGLPIAAAITRLDASLPISVIGELGK